VRYKSKRSKATDIPMEVKLIVYARDDERCIFCGRYGIPNAHIIPRSQGGLGVEQNIVTACQECHNRLDNSTDRPYMLEYAKNYLKGLYRDWNRDDLIYDKWRFLKREND